MKQFAVNIGLENNPYTDKQITNIVKATLGDKITSKVVLGLYNGIQERTLVLGGITDRSLYDVNRFIDTLLTGCTQECIPYKYDSFKTLKYNDKYQGDRYQFDEAYFIAPKPF
jgi:hypothetical protein